MKVLIISLLLYTEISDVTLKLFHSVIRYPDGKMYHKTSLKTFHVITLLTRRCENLKLYN